MRFSLCRVAIDEPKSIPLIDLPEPFPSCSSKPMTTVGLFVISLILEATMPTTPGCQPSPAAQD